MKKKSDASGKIIPGAKKLFLIMRLTIFLILISMFSTYASVYSQSTKLTLKMENARIADVFDAIEQQSEFWFFYNRDKFDDNRIVSVDFEGKKVEKILDELFAGQPVSYEIVNRNILIKTEGKYPGISSVLQQNSVSGTVTDETDEPLPGVTIMVKGTTTGTVTDGDGEYSLRNVPSDATLVFSYVGMLTQEIEVTNQTIINVTLVTDAIGIEEVVAIGYGTMKKSDLTGAVADIRADDIQNRVTPQTSTLLAGELSGVTVMQGSGNPGKDGATIRVRGLGTFSSAGSNPLVLIDGITGSINDVNPNDIESVSVLKDAASAAIYGARAANGVILIETKTGKTGEMKVDYNGYFGYQKPTEIPNFVDSWTYAEMFNEALKNEGGNIAYTEQDIEKFKTGGDPDNYPNNRRYDRLIKSGSGLQTDHDIRFSGGSLQNRYSLSLGYLNQEGLIEKNSYERYNLRLNQNTKVSDKLDLSLKLQAKHSIQNEPYPNPNSLISTAIKLPPTIASKLSDGTYNHVSGITLEGWLDSESFDRERDNFFLGNIELTYKILNNLTITGVGGYTNSDFVNRRYVAEVVLDENATIGPSSLTVTRSNTAYLTLQSFLKYNKSFNGHDFSLLAGYSQEEKIYEWDSAFRDNFPNNSLYQINAGSEENMQSNGSKQEWALRSYFGRFDYSFKGKYLVQLNARYDGSSRFPKGSKFDLFPSISAGWRISEENFFNVDWIDNFKIRSSYGELGNQEVGLYPYQQSIDLGQIYVFGGQVQPGAAVNTLPNNELSWETTKVADIGFDFVFFNGKLSFTSDYFNKRTEGILYNISSSTVLGLIPTEQNAGIVENRGIEFQIIHQNRIGDFSYSIASNLSYIKNEVISLFNVEQDIAKGLFVGKSISAIYGYVADGLFIDDADIESYPSQPYNAKPGYIRLQDISGPDGIPDGQVTPEFDRKVIGNEFPKYNFGINLSTTYKGFDLSIQLQGVAGIDDLLVGSDQSTEGLAFFKGSTPQQWMIDNRWTQENPDRNAKYPRLENTDTGHPENTTSTYWLRSAAFLRINNLQIGYSIPSRILEKINISRLRVYYSGSNLLTFDDYYEGWDPEMSGFYPPTSVSAIGINASF